MNVGRVSGNPAEKQVAHVLRLASPRVLHFFPREKLARRIGKSSFEKIASKVSDCYALVLASQTLPPFLLVIIDSVSELLYTIL